MGYSVYQNGIEASPSHKIPAQMRQSQSPRQPSQSNQRYLNINQSPIKKGIDLTQNSVTNSISD